LGNIPFSRKLGKEGGDEMDGGEENTRGKLGR